MAKFKVNKFYVGANHIAEAIFAEENDEWTWATEAKAVAHAKQLVADDGRDCVVVVKITHIVRRREQPVVVERV